MTITVRVLFGDPDSFIEEMKLQGDAEEMVVNRCVRSCALTYSTRVEVWAGFLVVTPAGLVSLVEFREAYPGAKKANRVLEQVRDAVRTTNFWNRDGMFLVPGMEES